MKRCNPRKGPEGVAFVLLLIGAVVVVFWYPGWRRQSQGDAFGSGDTAGSEPGRTAFPPVKNALASAAGEEGGDSRRASLPPGEAGNDDDVPVLSLPRQDHKELLRKARKREASGVYRFATAVPVAIAPGSAGVWDRASDGTARWRVGVRSPGAENLNFGFNRFRMPDGGRLTIRPPGGGPPYRDFTAADNEPHGELWTPLIAGDAAVLEIRVPEGKMADLELLLTSVNHGFRGLKRGAKGKIGGDSSGACNVDVACGDGDVPFGTMIDAFRDEVRSAAAYTLGGTDTCSGALINNTARDGRPFFLTAEHCGIDPSNAASMVVYWNFENQTCRRPDSSASGRAGDGRLDQFSTGAFFRASSPPSDFCLVELDDPIDPRANVFFAGWDRSGADATMAVAVHHPAVAEKRISFEFDTTAKASYFGDASPGDGTHVRVADWDEGTTEGGSSGSPLFNQAHHIIGQLHGGDADCGNDAADWYGNFSVSWNGGGSPGSRLRDWLDPVGTAATSLDGQNQDEVLTVADAEVTEGAADTTATLTFTVTLSPASEETVTVVAATQDGSAVAGEDYTPVSGATLTFLPGETEKLINVTVGGDATPEEHETVLLGLSGAENAFAAQGPGTGRILNDDFITPVLRNQMTAAATQGRLFTFQIDALNTPTQYRINDAPEGMTVDPATGLAQWTPPSPGEVSFGVVAANPAGSAQGTVTVTVEENSLVTALDLASSSTAVETTNGAEWFLTTETHHDGNHAAQSADVGDNGSSSMKVTVEGPDALVFFWNVSSEPGFDFLQLLLDGEVVDAISGQTGWRRFVLPVTGGGHTVSWRYLKDDSVSEGSDAGWVDELTFASQEDEPVVTSRLGTSAEHGVPYSYRFEIVNGPATFTTTSPLPPGLGLEEASGVLSGIPTQVGEFQVAVTIDNGTAASEETLTLTVTPPIGPALDIEGVAVTTTGESPWHGQSSTTHDGADAAQSGNIGDNGVSALEIEVTGPDTVLFWWKVSSEPDYDFLSFDLDGREQRSISGISEWKLQTLKIPGGVHSIRWRYHKDDSESGGQDAGWVDEVRLASAVTEPFLVLPADLFLFMGDPVALEIEALGNPTSFSAKGLPPGLSIDPTDGVVSGTPSTSGTFRTTILASNATGSTEETFTITVSPPIGIAVEFERLSWRGAGDAQWFAQPGVRRVGSSAAQSGNISDNETTALETTVAGPGTITFWWRVSSEENYDELTFELDGVAVDALSGESGWRNRTVDLEPGTHVLRWRFSKDESESDGSDAGWIDGIAFSGFGAWAATQGVPPSEAAATADPDGDGVPLLVEYALGLSPLLADRDRVPSATIAEGFLTLTVPLSPGAEDVTVTAEFTDDPTSGMWSTQGTVTIIESSDLLLVRSATPVGSGEGGSQPHGFMRLRASFD